MRVKCHDSVLKGLNHGGVLSRHTDRSIDRMARKQIPPCERNETVWLATRCCEEGSNGGAIMAVDVRKKTRTTSHLLFFFYIPVEFCDLLVTNYKKRVSRRSIIESLLLQLPYHTTLR
mmetsp:Transcript_4230/g.8635  ORF Transcript_4230/g.8635 Transcript_4230/m.8635 type:complete len:118 (-) Transcript_4230:317-670(-)